MDDLLPLNIRTFLDTVRGDQSKITERNLSQEDRDWLRQVIQKKQKYNADREFSLRNMLYDTPQEYRRNPETEMRKDVDGAWRPQPLSYTDNQAKIKSKLDSYERTRGKTSVSYGDYGVRSGEDAAPVHQGWGSALYQSFTDPAFRLASTLGSFNAYDKPDGGYRVEDTYGFKGGQQWYYNNAASKPLNEIVKRYWDQPGSLGEILYRKYLGDRSRPVEINIQK